MSETYDKQYMADYRWRIPRCMPKHSSEQVNNPSTALKNKANKHDYWIRFKHAGKVYVKTFEGIWIVK